MLMLFVLRVKPLFYYFFFRRVIKYAVFCCEQMKTHQFCSSYFEIVSLNWVIFGTYFKSLHAASGDVS